MSLPVGAIGFTRIKGFLGFLIALGQLLIGDACRYSHVFVVLDNNRILEAMPSGARIRTLTSEDLSGSVIFDFRLSPFQKDWLLDEARLLVGIPYGFSAYLNLALIRLGFTSMRLRKYLMSNNRLICSQLADELLFSVNYHVFNDKRLPHEVTPGDLFYEAHNQVWPPR